MRPQRCVRLEFKRSRGLSNGEYDPSLTKPEMPSGFALWFVPCLLLPAQTPDPEEDPGAV